MQANVSYFEAYRSPRLTRDQWITQSRQGGLSCSF